MKKMEQLYRAAPKRRSPEALDQRILQHAERQAAGNSRPAKKPRLLSSAWMPLAATAVVAVLSITVVLRNTGLDTDDLGVDGYANVDSSNADSSVVATSTGVSDQTPVSVAERQSEVSDELMVDATDASDDALPDTAGISESRLQHRGDAAFEKRLASADVSSDVVDTAAAGANPATGANIRSATKSESANASVAIADLQQAIVADSDSGFTAEAQNSQRQERIRSQVREVQQAQIRAPAQPDTSSELRGILTAPVSNSAVEELALVDTTPVAESDIAMSSGRAAAIESNSRQEAIILVGQGSIDWLNIQPESHYLLQLASADEEDYLLDFADSLLAELAGRQIAVVRINPSLYTLLIGDFSSFADAETALANLPQTARRFGARVRNVARLQQSLR